MGFLRNILVIILSLMCFSLSGTMGFASSDGAYIVTVDGLNFVTTLGQDWWPWGKRNSPYLMPAIESMEIGGDIYYYDHYWSPYDAVDQTVEEVQSLRDALIGYSRYASLENKKLIVVGHSWGTFIASAAMSYASSSSDWKGCDLLLLLGSPVGDRQVSRGATGAAEDQVFNFVWKRIHEVEDSMGNFPGIKNLKKLLNIWCWGDLISGPISSSVEGNYIGLQRSAYAEDIEADADIENLSRGNRRNVANIAKWHGYNSLQEGKDNEALRNYVKNIIVEKAS